MGKRFFISFAFLVFLFRLWPISPTNAENEENTFLPWGLSVRQVKFLKRALTRTFSGLNEKERHRIVKYVTEEKYFGKNARVYYSFKSNELYEIELDFKNVHSGDIKKIVKMLSKDYGKAKYEKNPKKKNGKIFRARSSVDYLWDNKESKINLRHNFNYLRGKKPIHSLFLTLRCKE